MKSYKSVRELGRAYPWRPLTDAERQSVGTVDKGDRIGSNRRLYGGELACCLGIRCHKDMVPEDKKEIVDPEGQFDLCEACYCLVQPGNLETKEKGKAAVCAVCSVMMYGKAFGSTSSLSEEERVEEPAPEPQVFTDSYRDDLMLDTTDLCWKRFEGGDHPQFEQMWVEEQKQRRLHHWIAHHLKRIDRNIQGDLEMTLAESQMCFACDRVFSTRDPKWEAFCDTCRTKVERDGVPTISNQRATGAEEKQKQKEHEPRQTTNNEEAEEAVEVEDEEEEYDTDEQLNGSSREGEGGGEGRGGEGVQTRNAARPQNEEDTEDEDEHDKDEQSPARDATRKTTTTTTTIATTTRTAPLRRAAPFRSARNEMHPAAAGSAAMMTLSREHGSTSSGRYGNDVVSLTPASVPGRLARANNDVSQRQRQRQSPLNPHSEPRQSNKQPRQQQQPEEEEEEEEKEEERVTQQQQQKQRSPNHQMGAAMSGQQKKQFARLSPQHSSPPTPESRSKSKSKSSRSGHASSSSRKRNWISASEYEEMSPAKEKEDEVLAQRHKSARTHARPEEEDEPPTGFLRRHAPALPPGREHVMDDGHDDAQINSSDLFVSLSTMVCKYEEMFLSNNVEMSTATRQVALDIIQSLRQQQQPNQETRIDTWLYFMYIECFAREERLREKRWTLLQQSGGMEGWLQQTASGTGLVFVAFLLTHAFAREHHLPVVEETVRSCFNQMQMFAANPDILVTVAQHNLKLVESILQGILLPR